MKIYTEIGYGLPTLFSTEIEFSDTEEVRFPGWLFGNKLESVALRLQLGKTHYIFSIPEGIKRKTKVIRHLKISLTIGTTLQEG